MRVLIVSQYFWPESFRINDLAISLKKKGHEITVLTGMPNYPNGRFFPGYGLVRWRSERYLGINVHRVPLIPRGKGGGFRLILNYLSFALCASILAPFVCRGHYDLIFVYEPSPITVGLPALVLKKLKSAPVMFWVQDLWPESLSATGAVRSEKMLKIVEKLVRFIYGGCDRILVQSRAFIAPVERVGGDPKRIAYFPNSAEELYRPMKLAPDAPERAGLPDGFCVMFAGNIGAAQDFGTILDAVERLKGYPDIHWVFIGDGRMRAWVEEEVLNRNLGGVVHLLGRHPVETMPRFFACADVLLVTLKKEPIFSLTVPSKLQSYLACAKPVIAALDGEGARIVEESQAGLTSPPEDPGALADAVLAVYRMSDAERCSMGQCGRAYFDEHFEPNLLLEQLDTMMKELVSSKKTSC